jgi:hypothetical protein
MKTLPLTPDELRRASTQDLLAWRDRILAEAASHFDAGQVEPAVQALRQLELATIDARTLEVTDAWLPAIAGTRRVVASFDPRRVPRAGELVIIYGNYPHVYANVVVNNPVRRHVADFGRFRHDVVEADPRWDAVEQVFVINSDARQDRYDDVLRELAAARAPFDRVTRIPAIAEDKARYGYAAGQMGCMRSHMEALRTVLDRGYRNVLVLEDDFCFTSDLEQHLSDLGVFFSRGYDFWVCLVATSKYGPIVPRDDLVADTYQACTNTAGHLLSNEGARQVLAVYEHALAQMKATGESLPWAVDRCWSVLQPSGKFLVFRRKWGFQTSSYSDIEGRISRYLD